MSTPRPKPFKFRELGSTLAPEAAPGSRRWITWRSVLVGFLLVLLLAFLTPYNDHVLVDSLLVGNFFPPFMVFAFLFITLVINAPLHLWAPRHALGSGELAVIMSMLLAACAIPGYGCMTELIPMLVGPFAVTTTQPQSWPHLMSLNLPSWLFPIHDMQSARLSPEVMWFITRAPEGAAVPYQSWILPLLVWSIFMFAMFLTLISLASLVRRQWAVNERLAFPLAQLEAALIEAPRAGKAVNDLMRSGALWIGLLLVLALHSCRMLNHYWPATWPDTPLYFDLRKVFTEEPWNHLNAYIPQQKIYLTFLGIAFFVQSRVSFSLWSIFVIMELYRMVEKWQSPNPTPIEAWDAQHVGSSLAFVGGFLWIGRKYWLSAFRSALSVRGVSSSADLRWPARGVIGGACIMAAWLLFMQVTPWVAAGIVIFILIAHCVVARIVAETGLPFIETSTSFARIATSLPATIFRGRDIFFSGFFNILVTPSCRESLMGFTLHGLEVNEKVAAQSAPESAAVNPAIPVNRASLGIPRVRSILALMAASILIAYVISAGSSLWCYYHYASPLAHGTGAIKINPSGIDSWPKTGVIAPLDQHAAGKFTNKGYNPWVHFGIGAAVTGALQFMSLRFSGWPFMPVGYLLMTRGAMQLGWFSIFVGWLCKVLVVRFGGARLYLKTRPFFIGIIFGDAVASAVWSIITIALASTGHDYQQANMLIR